jgi:hypothetical protein
LAGEGRSIAVRNHQTRSMGARRDAYAGSWQGAARRVLPVVPAVVEHDRRRRRERDCQPPFALAQRPDGPLRRAAAVAWAQHVDIRRSRRAPTSATRSGGWPSRSAHALPHPHVARHPVDRRSGARRCRSPLAKRPTVVRAFGCLRADVLTRDVLLPGQGGRDQAG